jgi:hypothetical protein
MEMVEMDMGRASGWAGCSRGGEEWRESIVGGLRHEWCSVRDRFDCTRASNGESRSHLRYR